MPFHIASLLLAIAVSASGLQPEGECTAPEQRGDSLLALSQKRSSQQVSVREAEHHVMQQLGSLNSQSRLLSLRQLAENTIMRDQNCSEEIMSAFGPTWNQMEIVKDSAVSATESDQAHLQEASTAVTACNVDAEQGSHTDSSSVDAARQTHATCRSEQAVLMESTTCANLEALKGSMSQNPPWLDACSPEASDMTKDFVRSISDWVKAYNHTFFEQSSACEAVLADQQAKDTSCDLAQAAFEMSYCVWAKGHDDAMEQHESCYSQATAAYGSAEVDIMSNIETRKAEYEAAERTQCLITVLRSNDTTLVAKQAEYEQCLNMDVDTTVLNVEFYNLPAKASIEGVTSRPCDDTWVETEFSSMSWESQQGTDLKSGEWDGYDDTSFSACAQLAQQAGVQYFAWSGQVYGGYCKVLKPSVTNPDLSTHQGYEYKLYESMLSSCIACSGAIGPTPAPPTPAPTPAPTPVPPAQCVDEQLVNGYTLCKVEFPGGCTQNEHPMVAALEYCENKFGSGWKPLADHGYACQHGYCTDAVGDIVHQAFHTCNNELPWLSGTCGVYYDTIESQGKTYCESPYGAVFICCGGEGQTDAPMSMFCVSPGR